MTEILQINEKPPAAHNDASAVPYQVMVVDDSSVIRGLITRAIEGHPLIHVAASAADGAAAVKALEKTPVDVIILDIEMPIMDGLTALPKLLEVDRAVKIIVASTLSLKNAEISLRALSLGAADYLPKPTSAKELTQARDFNDVLIEKVLELGAVARKSGVRQSKSSVSARPSGFSHQRPEPRTEPSPVPASATLQRRPPSTATVALRTDPIVTPDVILIASSTGGPNALFKTIKDLGSLRQPVLITQHMPASFTTILAEHISKQCNVICVEAKHGMVLEGGVYYVAPGDYHMLVRDVSGKPTIALTQDPHENFCRPAADPMLRSAVDVFGKKILVVVLTGMGQDGWLGSQCVVEAGGAVVAQDEATSVVWGMPGAVALAGLCSAILPLDSIGAYVRKIAQKGAS